MTQHNKSFAPTNTKTVGNGLISYEFNLEDNKELYEFTAQIQSKTESASYIASIYLDSKVYTATGPYHRKWDVSTSNGKSEKTDICNCTKTSTFWNEAVVDIWDIAADSNPFAICVTDCSQESGTFSFPVDLKDKYNKNMIKKKAIIAKATEINKKATKAETGVDIKSSDITDKIAVASMFVEIDTDGKVRELSEHEYNVLVKEKHKDTELAALTTYLYPCEEGDCELVSANVIFLNVYFKI